MGQAKRRREEIEKLKNEGAGANGRDRQILDRGIDVTSRSIEPIAAIARTLLGFFERAKTEGSIERPMSFFYSAVTKALSGVNDVPIACGKGCSHCCNIWVSVTAPEALRIAKIVKARGDKAIAKVRAAYDNTNTHDFDSRDQHPYPCPLLDGDICTIYDARPSSCRWAASASSEVCKRSYLNETNEDIPTPMAYLMGRNVFSLAMHVALRRGKLVDHSYEFNAALTRALETEDAETQWLAGEDAFAGVLRQPLDPDGEQLVKWAYDRINV
jgi:Fe-S-cluster containining protein